MSEELNNPFGGFQFLDGGTKKKETESEIPKTEEVNDGLSPEAIKALEETARLQAEASDKKKKLEKEEVEEEFEEEIEEVIPKKVVPKKETKEVEDDDDNPIKAVISHMAEKGIWQLDEEDKIETEEDLERIQINTINRGIQEYKDSIPEDGKKFLEFIESGGKPNDFFKLYYSEVSFEDYVPETEDDHKYIIREGLKAEGYSDDEIEDELEAIIDSERIEKKGSIYLKKLQKIEGDQKKLLLESQKATLKADEEKKERNFKEFKDRLFNSEEIAGFKLDKKVKLDLWDYMTKVDKKTNLTGYQQDINNDADVKYIFAYLLKNKWDMSSLEEMVETKQTSKLRSKLSRFTDTRTKLKTGKRVKEDPMRDTGNPFSGFKALI
jgi:hypothetical protein